MILLKPDRLGWFVRAKRRQLGYTQHALAELAEVGRPWLVELELGKRPNPALDRVIQLLAALGCAMQVIDLNARAASPSQPFSLEAKASQLAGNDDVQGAEFAKSRTSVPQKATGQERPEAKNAMFFGRDYAVADFGAAGIAVDRGQLDLPSYRDVLSSMVALVVNTEAPVFQDVLERRIASAHGHRLTNRLKLVIASLTKSFPSTAEGDRRVIWAGDPSNMTPPPFRSAPLSLRNHSDIPAIELEALAAAVMPGRTPDQAITVMSQHLGLSSVREATRERLLRAITNASRNGNEIGG